jgi:type II secretory pathway pseudopilin PulG
MKIRSISSLIVITIAAILALILVIVMSYIIAANVSVASFLSAIGINTQTQYYGQQYQQCMNIINQYNITNESYLCNNLLNVTNSTVNTLSYFGAYTSILSSPYVWIIFFVIVVAGIYVLAIQQVQFGNRR